MTSAPVDAADLPPYTFRQPCRQCGRRAPAMRNVAVLRATFGEWRALDLTTDAIAAYTVERLDAGLRPATVNRELSALKRMFRLAVQAGKLTHQPHIPMLSEEGNARTGFLEPADFVTLREHLPAWLADATTFAYVTGWRRSEVATLEWRDVSLRAREIRLRAERSKTKRPRTVKLDGELLALIERRAAGRRLDVPLVFHRGAGEPLGNFRKVWRTAVVAAKIPPLVFHDLRRSAIRNMVRAGIPERVAMEIAGHRTRSVFDRYNIVSEADHNQAAARMAGYLATTLMAPPRVVDLEVTRGTRLGGESAQNPHNPGQVRAAPNPGAATTA